MTLPISSDTFFQADKETRRRKFEALNRALTDAKDIFEDECRERTGPGGAIEARDESFDLEDLAMDIVRTVERWVAKHASLSIARVGHIDTRDAVETIIETVFDPQLGSGSFGVLRGACAKELGAPFSTPARQSQNKDAA